MVRLMHKGSHGSSGLLCRTVIYSADSINCVGIAFDALSFQSRCNRCFVTQIEPHVVVDALHSLAPVRVSDQDALVRRVGAPALPARDVPRVANHELEVVVEVHRGADVGVVLAELVRVDLAVLLALVEGVEELPENFALCLLARHDLGVAVHVVGLGDVVQVHHAGPVFVQHVERQEHHLLAPLVQLAAHPDQELVVGDGARRVLVKKLEDDLDLRLGKSNLALFHALGKLRGVEIAISGIVDDAKLPP
mmetsp:Transcript_3980/g.9463  ORF Transcript_3980/g.9463 Transcript_3980/m.9463 type:complete len:250 (+) Transcript_3980:529-1278(+)